MTGGTTLGQRFLPIVLRPQFFRALHIGYTPATVLRPPMVERGLIESTLTQLDEWVTCSVVTLPLRQFAFACNPANTVRPRSHLTKLCKETIYDVVRTNRPSTHYAPEIRPRKLF